MPSRAEDDWSDSDDEVVSGIETDVLLGVPDGDVDNDNNLRDVAVSRIGGLPVRVCPLYMYEILANVFFSRRYCLRGNPRFLLRTARRVRIPWNLSCRYGVH